MEDAGASVVLTDRIDAMGNAELLRPVLAQLTKNEQKLSAMGAAAARLGVPDAAERVAELIRQTCGL